jgi:hypothetical protein
VPPAPSYGANVPRTPLPGAFRAGRVCPRPRHTGPMRHAPHRPANSGRGACVPGPVYPSTRLPVYPSTEAGVPHDPGSGLGGHAISPRFCPSCPTSPSSAEDRALAEYRGNPGWAFQNKVCLRRVRGPRCGLVAPCGSGQPAAMRCAPFAASCPRGYRVDGAIVLVLCGTTAHRPASGGRDPMRKTADLAYNGRNRRRAENSSCFGMSTQSPRYSIRARSSTTTGQTTPDRVTAAALRDRRDDCAGPGQSPAPQAVRHRTIMASMISRPSGRT